MFFAGVLFGVGGVFLVAYLATKSKEKKEKQEENAKRQAENETAVAVDVSGVNENKGVETND